MSGKELRAGVMSTMAGPAARTLAYLAPVMARELGQPAPYSYSSSPRRRRYYFDDGSYRYISKRSLRRRRSGKVRSARKPTLVNVFGWNFGGKTKYRWPGD